MHLVIVYAKLGAAELPRYGTIISGSDIPLILWATLMRMPCRTQRC